MRQLYKNIVLLDGDEVTAEAKVLCRKKFEKTVYEYVKTRNQHMLLNYVNFPYIARAVLPYTDPPRPMIVLVGPPSCLKGLLVDVFCEIYPQYVSRGVSHTTRPRSEGEIDGEQYRFITYETFKDMMRKGLFFITSEYFGHLYGFAQSELTENSPKRSVIILHSDLNGALLLRARGLRPTLVLTIPKSEEMHRRYLRRKYICHSLQSGILEIGITFNKTYEGLMRMKNYTHRNVVIAVKDMLTEVFKNAWDDSSLGTIHNPDLSIYGGLTIQDLLDGTEDLIDQKSESKTSGPEESVSEWRYLKLLQTREQKIFCLKSKTEVQFNYLKTVGVDKIIKEYLLNDEDSIDKISDVQAAPNEGTNPKEDEPEVTEVPHLQRLFDEVIANRKTYLELHWANPGLFSQVLFTDQLDHGLDVLTEVLKSCVRTYHLRSPACKMKHPPKNHPIVHKRLEHLHSLMSTEGILENEKKNCHQPQLGFQNVEGKSYLNDIKKS
ncbi:hypothetical protein WA026_001985 [Henosepilachna vigintioctopunctata]|uniref:Guanylate kinase-like domain-containing protein n=1 Tax=Henosepilachna vigintioctopunctata TaxID=420089 RepID=A0AAW1UUZ1_9CUCU